MARIKDRTRQEYRTDAPIFRTATYARLSVDSSITESDSIISQQMLMRDFLKGRKEYILVREYKDDGISGTRFDRQAFDSLLAEVRKGEINCIVVKDFSRFGRDHIEVGNYLEKVFPFLGVRFISINDGYDSFDKDSADKKLAVILKNLVNEYVARDASLKAASSYRIKQENGEYDGGCAPYGYAFSDQRKAKFIVDEEAAEIVRNIFLWTMQGDSSAVIVKRLTEGNINAPRAYQESGNFYRKREERRYWSETTVNNILKNMVYAGHMALHKGKESKAEGIKSVRLEEAQWKVRKNAHEAIVSEADFLLVQEIMRARKEKYEKVNAMDREVFRSKNLLKGKVFCGDCHVPASRMGTNYKSRNEKNRIYRYRCRTYREKGIQECTSKSIAEKELKEIVYLAVMGFIWQTEGLEENLFGFLSDFFQKIRSRIEKEKRMEEDSIRQERNEKIRLYKEYSRRKRTSDSDEKEWYLREKQRREEEILYHEKRKAELKEKMAFFESLEKAQERWIREVFLCKEVFAGDGVGELTSQIAALFVDKIFLYDGKRVEIVLNFREE